MGADRTTQSSPAQTVSPLERDPVPDKHTAMLALQGAAGNLAARALASSCAPASPPSPRITPAPSRIVQRKIIKNSDNTFSTTKDPHHTKFPSRVGAMKLEYELKRLKVVTGLVKPRRSGRLGGVGKPDYAKAMASRRGVPRAANTKYPPPARLFVPQLGLTNYKRPAMGDPVREMLIESARAKPEAEKTAEEISMLAKPDQNMKDAGISMNHKLADSAVAAICSGIFHSMRQPGFTPAQEAAVQRFVRVMTEADGAWKRLVQAAQTQDTDTAVRILHIGVAELSHGWPNMRFGKAGPNTRILHGFDPNISAASGKETPRSRGILEAVRLLGTLKIVDLRAVDAAVQRTLVADTGEALSSSSVQ